MNKITIAFLIDTISSSKAGTEKQLLGLIQRLSAKRFRPILICLVNSSWLEKNQVPCQVHLLGYNGLIKPSIVGVVRRLKKLIKDEKIDIVQTFFEDSMIIGALTSFLCSNVTFISSRRDLGLGTGGEPWYHSLFRIIRPALNRYYNGVIANSEILKKKVVKSEGLSPDKVKVIFNGVSVSTLNVFSNKPDIFKKVAADIWIAVTANLKPIKRIDLFLAALNNLITENPDLNICAIILGEGGEREPLEKYCHQHNLTQSVFFLGRVENVFAYLPYIDIGVLCSDKEGLPNAIIEYMACGLPVVATDVGGISEIIDNQNGFLTPPGDSFSLCEALNVLVKDKQLRKRLGENSLQKVKKEFSWNRIVGEWENYYKIMHKGALLF